MSRDSPNAATAAPSGTATPATSVPMTGVVDSNGASSFSSAGSKISGPASFLAGSKSLDSMAQLITNCESLFHPSVCFSFSLISLALRSLASMFNELSAVSADDRTRLNRVSRHPLSSGLCQPSLSSDGRTRRSRRARRQKSVPFFYFFV
jgi:hypothetical protein